MDDLAHIAFNKKITRACFVRARAETQFRTKQALHFQMDHELHESMP